MSLLTYRTAFIEDLPVIVQIYNSTIASRLVTADTEPISVDSKISWFNDHHPNKRPLWMIEDEQQHVVGWASYQSFYGRPAYDATVEVSIYLDEQQRGKGYGKQVLNHCIEVAPTLGIKTLLGFIFAHNMPSLQLFYKAGFRDWGIFPDVANLDGIERTLKILGKRVEK